MLIVIALIHLAGSHDRFDVLWALPSDAMKLLLGLAAGKHHRNFQVLPMQGVGTEMDEEG
jgi:hypothetical protein